MAWENDGQVIFAMGDDSHIVHRSSATAQNEGQDNVRKYEILVVTEEAQSIASEQMDECFNDGTKFPRGWFGEGWKIENGKAKATEDSGNSGFPGMGGGGMPSPSTNPSDNPSAGMPGMGSMFGGGGASDWFMTPPLKSWAPHADSDAYELTTPSLQAKKGDVLRFYADISSGWLNVFYKRDVDEDWTYQNTYITADSLYFIAPLSGVYQLKFTGSSVSVDDFIGFQKPMDWAALMDDSQYDAPWGNKFLGVSMVFNFSNTGDEESLALHNIKWRIRTFFGLRLGK